MFAAQSFFNDDDLALVGVSADDYLWLFEGIRAETPRLGD
jgi:hypothetical protein